MKSSYTVSMKKFDLPSPYGIGGGRISKLDIRAESGQCLARYDRGWDIYPVDAGVAKIIFELMEEKK
jgi:hypothetical protein